MAAAIALKGKAPKQGLPGTVMYFGCPAEENFSGKAFMARDGVFDGLDACLTWHPGSLNIVRGGAFSGRELNERHLPRDLFPCGGSASPRQERPGRRGLMNVGVNYLREHIMRKQGFTT